MYFYVLKSKDWEIPCIVEAMTEKFELLYSAGYDIIKHIPKATKEEAEEMELVLLREINAKNS